MHFASAWTAPEQSSAWRDGPFVDSLLYWDTITGILLFTNRFFMEYLFARRSRLWNTFFYCATFFVEHLLMRYIFTWKTCYWNTYFLEYFYLGYLPLLRQVLLRYSLLEYFSLWSTLYGTLFLCDTFYLWHLLLEYFLTGQSCYWNTFLIECSLLGYSFSKIIFNEILTFTETFDYLESLLPEWFATERVYY